MRNLKYRIPKNDSFLGVKTIAIYRITGQHFALFNKNQKQWLGGITGEETQATL